MITPVYGTSIVSMALYGMQYLLIDYPEVTPAKWAYVFTKSGSIGSLSIVVFNHALRPHQPTQPLIHPHITRTRLADTFIHTLRPTEYTDVVLPKKTQTISPRPQPVILVLEAEMSGIVNENGSTRCLLWRIQECPRQITSKSFDFYSVNTHPICCKLFNCNPFNSFVSSARIAKLLECDTSCSEETRIWASSANDELFLFWFGLYLS